MEYSKITKLAEYGLLTTVPLISIWLGIMIIITPDKVNGRSISLAELSFGTNNEIVQIQTAQKATTGSTTIESSVITDDSLGKLIRTLENQGESCK